MRIVFLTPGTGGWYCGACMRDNALAKSLHAAGHEVSLLPMYLPLKLDEDELEQAAAHPVFFGGINLYLQHKFPFFRRAPGWLDRLLNRPGLLRRMARHSHLTSSGGQGAVTLAMLRLEESGLDRELIKLTDWLERHPPDVLCLSTALQAGMIRGLKQRLGVKILCFFQGEDAFLDGLPDDYREACWRELAVRVREADLRVAPSASYAELMRRRLGPEDPAIRVLHNGIHLEGYAAMPQRPGPPVIGFLARMCREKGLEVMVDAFIHLRTVLGHPDAGLQLAGTSTAGDKPLINALKRRIAAQGLTAQVVWRPNLSRAEKAAMLGTLTLFSVPVIQPEAFGLYVIEAMASGVPVVQPAASSFPELVAESSAGMLVPPGNPVVLAQAWHDLLRQPEVLRGMAERGRRAAEQRFDIRVMRDGFIRLAREITAKPG